MIDGHFVVSIGTAVDEGEVAYTKRRVSEFSPARLGHEGPVRPSRFEGLRGLARGTSSSACSGRFRSSSDRSYPRVALTARAGSPSGSRGPGSRSKSQEARV